MAEQYRLRAELLAQNPATAAKAEPLLHRAVDLAHSQQARSLELRALTSLVQLQNGPRTPPKGAERLSQCYAGFTEGFELPDLQDAKTLLDG